MNKTSILLLALAAFTGTVSAADVTGTWHAEFDSQIGVQKYTYTLKQEGTQLSGKASSEVNDRKRETELTEGKVEVSCGNKDGLIRISQGLHAYLKEKSVPHIWHVDEHAHDFQHWKKALFHFSQLIFKPASK